MEKAPHQLDAAVLARLKQPLAAAGDLPLLLLLLLLLVLIGPAPALRGWLDWGGGRNRGDGGGWLWRRGQGRVWDVGAPLDGRDSCATVAVLSLAR